MLGIGYGEMLVIALLLLLAVGPEKLPQVVKTVARTYRQVRRTAQELRASTGIDDLLRDEELRELAELRKQRLLEMSARPKPPPPTDTPLPMPASGGIPIAPPSNVAPPSHTASSAPAPSVIAAAHVPPGGDEDEVEEGPVATASPRRAAEPSEPSAPRPEDTKVGG